MGFEVVDRLATCLLQVGLDEPQDVSIFEFNRAPKYSKSGLTSGGK